MLCNGTCIIVNPELLPVLPLIVHRACSCMRAIYKFVLLALLVFMFRSPLLRLHQTASFIIKHSASTSPATAPRTFSITALRQDNDTMSSDRPNGLIAKKGLELLTFGTPNGHKANIILEEIKEAYGKPDYVWQSIHIGQNIQVCENSSPSLVSSLTFS